jgi:predicted aspartyl protease
MPKHSSFQTNNTNNENKPTEINNPQQQATTNTTTTNATTTNETITNGQQQQQATTNATTTNATTTNATTTNEQQQQQATTNDGENDPNKEDNRPIAPKDANTQTEQTEIEPINKINSATHALIKCNGQAINALIDTGAYTSMISTSATEEYGIQTTPINSNKIWQTANGGKLQVVAIANVPLQIGNYECDHDLIVANDLSQKLIIGTDVLRKSEAIIRFDTNELTIENSSVGLNTANPEKDKNDKLKIKASKSFVVAAMSERTTTKKVSQFARPGDIILVESYNSTVVDSLVEVNENNEIAIVHLNANNKDELIRKKKVMCTLTRLDQFDEALVKKDTKTTETHETEKINIVTEHNDWRPSEVIKPFDDYLNEEQIKTHKELIDKHADIFSRDDDDIGEAKFEHVILLDKSVPLKTYNYQIPYAKRKIVEEQIEKMQRIGVIEPSDSEYSSPIVLVKKADGTDRFCIDFRGVNLATVKDNYPMPLIREKLDSLSNCKYFTTLDLTSGYWQFKMEPESKKYTAFTSHLGVFQCKRMPFGLCNAGATFQRAMERMLNGVKQTSPYMDDIFIYQRSFSEYLKTLEEVFNRIRAANLKIKTKKCQFCRKQTKFLGFIVSEKGVNVDPEKVNAIKNYPKPANSKQVKQFLGLASYYRQFIDKFSEKSEALNALTKKRAKFIWTEKCEQEFQDLTNALTTPPVLIFPDFSRTFRVTTDASAVGVGAILSQVDDDKREGVIAYASRTLNKHERNYSAIERELLMHFSNIFCHKEVSAVPRRSQIRIDHRP